MALKAYIESFTSGNRLSPKDLRQCQLIFFRKLKHKSIRNRNMLIIKYIEMKNFLVWLRNEFKRTENIITEPKMN